MLPPAGTPTPSPSPAYYSAAALHPAAWGVQRISQDVIQPASPAQPPAPPSTPQVLPILTFSACNMASGFWKMYLQMLLCTGTSGMARSCKRSCDAATCVSLAAAAMSHFKLESKASPAKAYPFTNIQHTKIQYKRSMTGLE